MASDRMLPPDLPTRPGDDTADIAAIDRIVTLLYTSLSGPSGQRSFEALKALFHPQARLTWTRPPGQDRPWLMTIDEFVEASQRYFAEQGMWEVEIARHSDVFGKMAHVFSTYEARHAEDALPFARGINSIQLVKDEDRWSVLSMVWDDERQDQPIPAQYLRG